MQISVRGNLEHLPDTCDINCGESNYMYEVNATNVNFELSSVTIKLGFDGLSRPGCGCAYEAGKETQNVQKSCG